MAGDSGIPRLPQPHAEMRKLALKRLLFLEGPFTEHCFFLLSQNWVIPPREVGGQLTLDSQGLELALHRPEGPCLRWL